MKKSWIMTMLYFQNKDRMMIRFPKSKSLMMIIFLEINMDEHIFKMVWLFFTRICTKHKDCEFSVVNELVMKPAQR